jgi:hypothetical protein
MNEIQLLTNKDKRITMRATHKKGKTTTNISIASLERSQCGEIKVVLLFLSREKH